MNTEAKFNGIYVFGWLLIASGIIGTLYFLFMFDVSVSTPEGNVNNIGLLNDRLIGILISLVVLMIGTLLVLFAPRKSSPASPRSQIEMIDYMEREWNKSADKSRLRTDVKKVFLPPKKND